jgi:tripartite-type tricarboxylate transporter receptor subunit TctC
MALLASATAAAQIAATVYPTRPIKMVVALSVGGVLDGVSRVIASKLETALGQPVVVENKPGASGNIAADYVARAEPDGYTLLTGATALTVLPTTVPSRAVDPLKQLTPVTRLATQPVVIVVHPSLSVDSLAELVARAREAPGKIAYATAGVATSDHLAATLLSMRANVDMIHVPYNNVGQETKDLTSGEIKVAFVLLGSVQAYVRSGALKAIAVTTPQRIDALPNVPTVAESGYPGYEVVSWYGLFATGGTPKDRVDRIYREVAKILEQPDVRAHFAANSLQTVGNTPEQFAEEVKSLIGYWRPVIKAAGIGSD